LILSSSLEAGGGQGTVVDKKREFL